MTHRLKEFSPGFIHEHQFGCLPERQLKDNMSTLVDVMEYLQQYNKNNLYIYISKSQIIVKVTGLNHVISRRGQDKVVICCLFWFLKF